MSGSKSEGEEEVVRYEERGAIAVITLNRPERLNTLTEPMVQGVYNGPPPKNLNARTLRMPKKVNKKCF